MVNDPAEGKNMQKKVGKFGEEFEESILLNLYACVQGFL